MIDVNNSILLLAKPFANIEPLLLDALSNHLSQGLKAILFVTDKPVRKFLGDAESYLFNFKKYINKSLFLIDASDCILRKFSLVKFMDVINSALKGFKGLVCFSNASAIIDLYGKEFINEFGVVAKKFKVLSSVNDWIDDGLLDSLKSVFKRVAIVGIVNNFNYCVLNDSVFFFNASKEGVIPVVPKLLFDDKALVNEGSLFDELSRNFRIGNRVINYKGLSIDVINGDFKQMIELFSNEPINPVIMINSKDALDSAFSMISHVKRNGLMPVVCALSRDSSQLSKSLKFPVVSIINGQDPATVVLNELIK